MVHLVARFPDSRNQATAFRKDASRPQPSSSLGAIAPGEESPWLQSNIWLL